MAGLGFVLGGLAQGLGAGLVKQGEMQAEEAKQTRALEAKARLDTMLENLRAQREGENIRLRGKVDDTVDASKQERKAGYDAEDDERDTKNSIKLESVKTSNRLREIGAEGAKEVSVAKVRAGLDRANSTAEIQLRDSLDKGDVTSTFKGDDGLLYVVKRDGSTATTGVKYNPRALEKSDDDLLLPPAAPTPTAPALKFVRDPKTGKIVKAS